MKIAIQAYDLAKYFGQVKALDGVDIEIPYGSIFGYLGANGAGKSTTIKILCGILAPTRGKGTVGGFDINTQPEQIKTVVGYVSQKFSLYTDLTVLENLTFFGRIYGLNSVALRRRIDEIMALTGLNQYKDRIAGQLSGGWKQKLAIANGILHEPKIIFLDEPTVGIDPLSRRLIWDVLKRLAQQGAALFVTTHYMEEAARCDEIAFISAGKLLRKGTPASFSEIAPNLEDAFAILEGQHAQY